MVMQLATIIAEIAEQDVELETGAKDVVEEVEAVVLLIPSLLTISVSLWVISGPTLYMGGHS